METRFYVSEPGDCDHLTDKAQKMLALYRHAICDETFEAEEVESIVDILKSCGPDTELRGKQVLRKILVASIPKWKEGSIEAFEATAMIGRLDQEIKQLEAECEELSLNDEETEDEKMAWFGEEYAEEIAAVAAIHLKDDLDAIVENNPALVDAQVVPCSVKITDAVGVSSHQEFALRLYVQPEDPWVTLTIDDLEHMLSVLRDYKPVETDGQGEF
ncbi:MAG TPA: hypothetical protein VN038_15320 [Dyadobacter sp.]|nr:hypothetical protein [Dyadobacter sp.]